MYRIFSLILCSISLLTIGCSTAQEDYSTIIFFIGDVKKNNAEAEIGGIVNPNDTITTGAQSSCDIKIGGSIVRIKEKSKMIISSLLKKGDGEQTTLGLEMGKILCKTKKLMKSDQFMVKTPTSVAGVRGTKFSVETDAVKTARIKVYGGKVKVVKRIKQFEGQIDKLLEAAPSVSKEEKVVITEKEVAKAEKIVEKVLKEEKAKVKDIEVAIKKAMETVKEDVVVSKNDIKKFQVEDFKEESKEIIAVEEKPKDVINEIAKIVKIAKKTPKPEGRLLVTRYELFYIKKGKVEWQGKVIKPPLKIKDKIYIASGDYVFCASADGPVLWKRKMQTNGNIEIKDNKLFVSSKGKIKELNLKTGKL